MRDRLSPWFGAKLATSECNGTIHIGEAPATPLSHSAKPPRLLRRTLSWGETKTHEIVVTQAEKDDKRDTFRRIMHSSDEEQRQLHEEILALRQQLGQEAIAAIPSSTTEGLPNGSNTNQDHSQSTRAGQITRVANQDGDSFSCSDESIGRGSTETGAPQIIEMRNLPPESVGLSRQVQVRAPDGTRYTLAAPDVESGTSVRLMIPSITQGHERQQIGADHGGGRHAEMRTTVLPASKIGRGGKAQVDEELSETEALVAQMRLELGLASDTAEGVANLSATGSG